MGATRKKWVGPPECGHPDRAHQAKGLCAQCYYKQYDENRSRRKDPDDYDPGYRKPPHKPKRMADCHPDRTHAAFGLCQGCYDIQHQNKVSATCHSDRPHVADGLCATCYSKRRYDQDPETARRQQRETQKRIRLRNRTELLAAYGGRCACPRCPETNPAFLTLEHVGLTGKAHREKVGSHVVADLRRRGWPQEGFTLLCWNCNLGTRRGNLCPHMEDAD